MTNIKCPFCKKELKLIGEKSDSEYPIDEYVCGCPSCPETAFIFGNTVMWNKLRVLHERLEERRESCKVTEKELIRTRKALDVAVDALKSAKARLELINNSKFANLNNVLQIQSQCEVLKINKALEQITALEQKDVK